MGRSLVTSVATGRDLVSLSCDTDNRLHRHFQNSKGKLTVKSTWNDRVFFSNLSQMNPIKLKRGFDKVFGGETLKLHSKSCLEAMRMLSLHENPQ